MTQRGVHLRSSARPGLFDHLNEPCISIIWSGPKIIDMPAIFCSSALCHAHEVYTTNWSLNCEYSGTRAVYDASVAKSPGIENLRDRNEDGDEDEEAIRNLFTPFEALKQSWRTSDSGKRVFLSVVPSPTQSPLSSSSSSSLRHFIPETSGIFSKSFKFSSRKRSRYQSRPHSTWAAHPIYPAWDLGSGELTHLPLVYCTRRRIT